MGLIRKAMSVSTFGGVKYTSLEEARTKLALEEAKTLRAQRKQATRAQAAAGSPTAAKWELIVAQIESGAASWDDLSRLQKLSMPIGYQIRCKAATRKRVPEETGEAPDARPCHS